MTEQVLSDFEQFLSRAQKFIDGNERRILPDIFPGSLMSLGDALSPVSVPVHEAFRSFIFRIERPRPVTLNFSVVVFVGHVDGDTELADVSSYATCSQSSYHAKKTNPQLGVTGGIHGVNVHTEKEVRPWWRADFPDNVKVTHIYLRHRPDINSERLARLAIIGVDAGGDEKTIYCPGNFFKPHMHKRVQTGVAGFHAVRDCVSEENKPEFDSHVGAAFARIEKLFEFYETSGQQDGPTDGILKSLQRLFGHKPKSDAPPRPDADYLTAERQEAAESLIAAMELALENTSDFGYTKEDALEVRFPARRARFVKVRVFGSHSVGFGGLEMFGPTGEEGPVATFNDADLKFRYEIGPYQFPECYAQNLLSAVHSRIVEMDDTFDVDRFLLWNKDRQQAGGCMFAEVSLSEDRKNWQTIYDHGASYKHMMYARVLIDILVRNRWPLSYARLLGKLYTVYRRRNISKPLAKTVQHKPELVKAVGEGAEAALPLIKHAMKLRFTKHGLQVPISERDQTKILKDLVELTDKLKALGLKPMLMYGTLLGAIREKDFIQHDDDLDIAVIVDGIGKDGLVAERDKLADFLNENDVPCKARLTQTPLIHCKRGAITIDIFVIGHVDGIIHWPHRRLMLVEERADIFLPAKQLEFKGHMFDGPADPPAVCEARYGEGWQTPEPTFEL